MTKKSSIFCIDDNKNNNYHNNNNNNNNNDDDDDIRKFSIYRHHNANRNSVLFNNLLSLYKCRRRCRRKREHQHQQQTHGDNADFYNDSDRCSDYNNDDDLCCANLIESMNKDFNCLSPATNGTVKASRRFDNMETLDNNDVRWSNSLPSIISTRRQQYLLEFSKDQEEIDTTTKIAMRVREKEANDQYGNSLLFLLSKSLYSFTMNNCCLHYSKQQQQQQHLRRPMQKPLHNSNGCRQQQKLSLLSQLTTNSPSNHHHHQLNTVASSTIVGSIHKPTLLYFLLWLSLFYTVCYSVFVIILRYPLANVNFFLIQCVLIVLTPLLTSCNFVVCKLSEFRWPTSTIQQQPASNHHLSVQQQPTLTENQKIVEQPVNNDHSKATTTTTTTKQSSAFLSKNLSFISFGKNIRQLFVCLTSLLIIILLTACTPVQGFLEYGMSVLLAVVFLFLFGLVLTPLL